MSEVIDELLPIVDSSFLTAIVRQDQKSPNFELLDWNVKRLSDKGIANPDGLFCFSGTGLDERGIRDWWVVLKRTQDNPDDQTPIDSFWYGKREILAIEAGLLRDLPGPVATPRCYNVIHHVPYIDIWMEYIHESVPTWSIDDYTFAAYELGRFNAAYLTGKPMPDFPWLARETARVWSSTFPVADAWDNPYVQRAFPPPLQQRVLQLWNEREQFWGWLRDLPQTFSHFDYHRRNLIIRQKAVDEKQVVAFDWAICGNGPIGGDLAMLVGMSANLLEIDLKTLPELETAVFDAYCRGLNEAGWTGDRQLPRLGYTASMAMFCGSTVPVLTAIWTDKNLPPSPFDALMSRDEMATHWAGLCEFTLESAHEARQLAQQLF
jgi:hypothetical protein